VTVVALPLDQLQPAPWNPNTMSAALRAKLRASLERFGTVQVLVVRPVAGGSYEVVNGNQRLAVYRELGVTHIPCAVVTLSDAEAYLLAQTLHHLQGEEDPGRRAALLREVLQALPETEVLALLPETAATLQALTRVGQEELAQQLDVWAAAAAAKLHTLTFQLTAAQEELVTRALGRVLEEPGSLPSPTRRGEALARLCRAYLEGRE
jgi:ParB family chromosome partitioning protein